MNKEMMEILKTCEEIGYEQTMNDICELITSYIEPLKIENPISDFNKGYNKCIKDLIELFR